MTKFLKSTIVFGIPFILIAVLLVYIDPYNVIRTEKDKNMATLKSQISYKLNYPLYQLQAFDNAPTDVVILGDSRAKALDKKVFENQLGKAVTNLAYGGGTLPEIIETFKYLTQEYDLNQIYIGINFNLYNLLNNKNRVVEANNIRSSYISYLSSKYCVKSAFIISKSMMTGEKVEIGKPTLNREEFWAYKLNHEAAHFLENYSYPKDYFDSLTKMSKYCKANNIKLVFFISPTHVDLQAMIKTYKRTKDYDKFIGDLKSLNNTIYDFNFSNEVTLYKENYGDPLHFNDSISMVISKIIVRDKLSTSAEKIVRKY